MDGTTSSEQQTRDILSSRAVTRLEQVLVKRKTKKGGYAETWVLAKPGDHVVENLETREIVVVQSEILKQGVI